LRVEDAFPSGIVLKEVQRTGDGIIDGKSERRKDFIRLQDEYSMVK